MRSEDKLLEELISAATSEPRENITLQMSTELVADLFNPRWLVIQKIILECISGEQNKLVAIKPVAENLGEMAKIQGRIQGLRDFWNVIVEQVSRAAAKEDEKNEA